MLIKEIVLDINRYGSGADRGALIKAEIVIGNNLTDYEEDRTLRLSTAEVQQILDVIKKIILGHIYKIDLEIPEKYEEFESNILSPYPEEPEDSETSEDIPQ